ncbi:MAG: hypothetical protein PSN35_07165 [Candidatus Thioglobus sp.]|uniref:hypothetical protein n=1 Tax=Candidatus Thioglobus sp. TaxID=2026721 RepID=UPI00263662A5|nr:hypothetical protein [Candidatus Thioglobus sp.]MDC9727597.1 hypothetical protein [Candidatus Thioglobus sp.]
MSNIVERGFYSIVHKLGFVFALLSLALIVFLGLFGYEKISSRATDEIKPPVIELAKYQNPISLNINQPNDVAASIPAKSQPTFTSEFDAHIERIITNLQALPEGVITQADLQFKIKVMIKIKSNAYPQPLQLSYVKSLDKLTKQLVNVGGNQVNIDDFLNWYDQEFTRQVDQQTQQNLMRIGSAREDQMTGFMSLSMAAMALGFFIMFVMMLAMLRIERNTRR